MVYPLGMSNFLERFLPRLIQLNQRDPLTSPMVFVSGPRQVGKTFLAKKMVKDYYNWDTAEVKKAFRQDPYFFRSGKHWLVFDEIHKRRDWKKLLKGYYDSPNRRENFFVTGSGRFNIYQKGGDSLQGRYDAYELNPVVYDEWIKSRISTPAIPRDFLAWQPQPSAMSDKELIEMGGFPVPLISGTRSTLTKWMDQYIERLVQEDIRDFSKIVHLDKVDLLVRFLPSRLMSPLSAQSLSEDVEVSRETIKSWLRLLEILYLGFQIQPYARQIHRAVKREKKWYFYQWTFAEGEAARFENYTATQLQATCRYWRDQGLGRYELFYLRDQDRREVDFVITKNFKPVALVEAKLSPQDWPSSLFYYCQKLSVPGFLVYPEGPVKRVGTGKWSLPSAYFLKNLLVA